MSAITPPASLKLAKVRATYKKAIARSKSPYTFESQTYVWPGSLWSFTFSVAPIKSGSAALAYITFLRDLAKDDNYFAMNVSAYVPADVGPTLNLRLSDAIAEWDVDTAKVFGITFNCEENK